MLYNHEKNLTATEERIRNSSINEANKQHIFEFESYCFSDGLKIARVLKHLTELKVLAEMVGQDFKSLIRKFFRWLGREDIVDWIKIPMRKDSRKLPEDMLSQEEIEKMINACEHPRDKAMVACLYESGTRISELGDMKIKHVKFDQYGAVLIVDGKTGMRRVRIIFSSPYLATWLENHPFRDNPEAFVWVGIGTVGRNVPLQYGAIRMLLKRIAEKAGAPSKAHIRQLVQIKHEERVSRHLITEPHTQSGNGLM